MTRDDIIRMAREAGMAPAEIVTDKPVIYPVPEAIERFAALVAAAEREECAKLVDEEMADYRYGTPPNIALNNAAAAIRARGCKTSEGGKNENT
jgi:predicted ATPase